MAPSSIPGLFAAQVAVRPDAVAVSAAGVRLTYRELDRRAERLAGRIAAFGAGPGTRVALLAERSPDVVVALLAILRTGAVAVPLHEAYPVGTLQGIVDDTAAVVLLADDVMRERGLPSAPRVVLLGEDTGPRMPVPPPVDDPAEVAYIIHTSGSTGRPKGVAVTHGGVADLVRDSCWDTGRHRRTLMTAPYAFAVSAYEIWVPLLRGGHLVIAPPGPLGADAIRDLITGWSITGLHLTAGLFRVLAEEAPESFAGVEEVLTGGDVIAAGAVRRVLERCPGTIVRGMYGASETTLFTMTCTMAAPDDAGTTVPLGSPMDGVRLEVLGEDRLPVPDGGTGELYVGTPRLAHGYADRPELTADRFVTIAGRRLFRTGDLVRLGPGGRMDFAGRSGDLVKIRGFRVEPGEVEAVLSGLPGVAHVVVVATRDDAADRRLIAYVVPGADGVGVPELAAHAGQALPGYLVPSAFVVIDALPLTPNGKVDRAALPEPAPAAADAYLPPVTDRQRRLCRIFAEVLGVDRVGLSDSFFDLDGQSLLAIRLVGRVRAEIGADLAVGDIFNAPTVGELDALVETATIVRG